MLPVGGVRLNEAAVVGEDRLDRFGQFRGRGREGGRDRAGFDVREDREPLYRGEIVRHQVDDGVGGRPERLRIHVDEAVDLGVVDARRSVGRGHVVMVPAGETAAASTWRRGRQRSIDRLVMGIARLVEEGLR